MTKELTAAAFDYSALDKDTKGKLLCIAREVKQAKKQHSASGLLIGESIAMAHSLFAVDGRDGEFSQWVAAECGFGRTTAYNYMWAWQRFGNCSTVEQFDDGALYALASPKAPPQAAKEAEKLADKGQKITLDRAKELLDKFSDKPKPSVAGKPKEQPKTTAPKPSQSDPILADKAEPAATGPCPHGGEHDYDDEACKRCHDPKPKGKKISGGATFNTDELSSEAKDAFGQEPPDELRRVFELCEGFDEQRAKLSSIKKWMTVHCSSSHPGAAVMQSAAQRIRSDIDQADAELLFCRPYCVCVYCHNKDPKVANCNACKGLGWITEKIYEAAPKGMKREKVKA